RLGGPTTAFGPRISPDGKLLAFQAIVNGQTQVGVMRPGSQGWSLQTHASDRGWISDLCWSSDGNTIFFDRGLDLATGIFSVPAVGTGDERLVVEKAMWPSALPDGSLILTKETASSRQVFRFWPENQRLQPLNAYPSRGSLFWSPVRPV